jgi:hypothetical protein
MLQIGATQRERASYVKSVIRWIAVAVEGRLLLAFLASVPTATYTSWEISDSAADEVPPKVAANRRVAAVASSPSHAGAAFVG